LCFEFVDGVFFFVLRLLSVLASSLRPSGAYAYHLLGGVVVRGFGVEWGENFGDIGKRGFWGDMRIERNKGGEFWNGVYDSR